MNDKNPSVHFTAIGGSIMHDLAINLVKKGYHVTGSDDEIYEPARSNLARHGLLPDKPGWNPEKVTQNTDALILGMHALKDNPELIKAKDLGIKIYSYPEYIFEQTQDKQRVVIAGSHGKTTITAIILHVLQYYHKSFDYLVGAQIPGFDSLIRLTYEAPVIIIEGDEYLSAPTDPTPKFLKYNHHMGLISGISWDHFNVFPTFEEYAHQFEIFADNTPKGGSLIYCEEDKLVNKIGKKERADVYRLPYKAHKHKISNGNTCLLTGQDEIPVHLIGYHNMQNISGAMTICRRLGILDEQFYEAIQNFKGASKRTECIRTRDDFAFYKDYAHAPSKLKATTNALKKQFPTRKLVACMELHTFSSLNKNFINQYKDALNNADAAIVYYNPQKVIDKNLGDLDEDMIRQAFNRKDLQVFTDTSKLVAYIKNQNWHGKNLLMMSSGNFNGLDLDQLSEELV